MAASQPGRTNRTGKRRWLFRSAAVLMGLSAFALIEVALAVLKLAPIDERDDPFVGFDGVRKLFVLDEAGERMEIPRFRLQFFAPESFPLKKEKQTFRIFCLGGSTVQGRPYSSETSFTTWLKLSLESAAPKRNWEVVNCGGISYASYRLVPILQECLDYEPDLFIICTGHNEFLEERTYGPVKRTAPILMELQRQAAKLRTYALLRAGDRSLRNRRGLSADKPQLPTEVGALLDFRRGIESYHRDADFRAGVIAHFEHNVRRMIALSHAAGVPLILIRPPSNLRDSPPFKSQHRNGLTPDDLDRWEKLIGRARGHYRDDVARSIELFRQSLDVDGEYAAIHYDLGHCYLLSGQPDRARAAFWKARELDICPLRMTAPLEDALSNAAAESETPLIDAFELLEAECPGGILGDRILVDHVHPKFRGHQLIANSLTEMLIAQGWVKAEADWTERRAQAYRRHFESLESVYFARGLLDLKRLRAWAAGRADEPELKSARERRR